ncbi:putative transcriptional regulator, XRE family [Desulforamulus reducens MI-1]|uniref:Putative transcriptional regulator, XRE family n=1 Tax=Desulforamulus reducens (strain ATCC BAA-1160 / DSM 100696 / MI-1) TaxID=349161 RepID=A4J3W2_DESRM|nr:helix-turn-helix transcriptional regulator [Desulforamulus reducens]ABO49765.1 putative transcriptional regulator, XRE family [Desulforamulus reducens MI-1]
MSVGKSIAKLRKQKKWTQSKLAKETGLSRGYIASIEQGRRHPALKTLTIIAEKLGVEMRELIRGGDHLD